MSDLESANNPPLLPNTNNKHPKNTDKLDTNHEHRFVIPVEWRYIHKSHEAHWHDETPLAKKVTRLRCECGEEQERI